MPSGEGLCGTIGRRHLPLVRDALKKIAETLENQSLGDRILREKLNQSSHRSNHHARSLQSCS